ncbi:ABC transporter ATP-binding protein [Thermaerobacter sp. PB12/4term]|uniref:ABC transporter ATP-binding protein n=1 Tax=Thermaerobacter sp. PB12/4term TaxID=2293838 RepID=UPI0026A320A3|nr:ABC transporter ATP-binding protein [Thermaerobacter sp. PB12/4term]
MKDAGAPVIRCRGLVKRFGPTQAVAGLDLDVYRGEILVLVGPSGCGKTTTLRLIAGFEVPDAGRIELSGRVVAGAGRPVPPEERRAGLVFQEYALFPHLTVAENIAFGLPRGPERRRRVAEMVELVRLEGLEDRYPHELSGGQQQRVALARALAPRPQILLLDEPFSNLDADLRQQVREEVREILRRTGTTTVLVTHDRREALNLGDRVAVMHGGRIEQVGTPEEVYYRPLTPFVAEFMGPATLLEGRVEPGGIATELGFFRQGVTVAPGTPVRVLVRPDDVTLRPLAGGRAAGWTGPGATGVIAGRERRDGYYHYRVRLDSGTVVGSELVHVYDYPAGTRVFVTVDAGHPLHWFPVGDEPAPDAAPAAGGPAAAASGRGPAAPAGQDGARTPAAKGAPPAKGVPSGMPAGKDTPAGQRLGGPAVARPYAPHSGTPGRGERA